MSDKSLSAILEAESHTEETRSFILTLMWTDYRGSGQLNVTLSEDIQVGRIFSSSR